MNKVNPTGSTGRAMDAVMDASIRKYDGWLVEMVEAAR